MKLAVVYWSGTGNTQAMANAIAEGARGAGAGITLANDSLIINNTPDADGEAKCREFGAALVK